MRGNPGKMRSRITPNTDSFYAVISTCLWCSSTAMVKECICWYTTFKFYTKISIDAFVLTKVWWWWSNDDEVAINHLKQKILVDLKEQYEPSTTYHLDSSVINFLKDHIKSLESEIQFLRKEIKEKNTLISSLIPSKILESKYLKQIIYKSLTAGPVVYRNEKQNVQHQGMH